jgi:hypothetical protein
MPTDSGRAVARAPADKRATRCELVPGRATFGRDLNDRTVRPGQVSPAPYGSRPLPIARPARVSAR